MAKRILRKRMPITSTLSIKLFNELDNLSEQTDVPKSKLLDKSVEFLVEHYRREDLLKNEDIDYLDIPIPRNIVNRLRLFAGMYKVNFDDYIVSILLDHMIKENKKLDALADHNAQKEED